MTADPARLLEATNRAERAELKARKELAESQDDLEEAVNALDRAEQRIKELEAERDGPAWEENLRRINDLTALLAAAERVVEAARKVDKAHEEATRADELVPQYEELRALRAALAVYDAADLNSEKREDERA